MAKRKFIKQFLKHNTMIGSVTPSSRFLCEKMVENIDFASAKVLVELGPGTGVFTHVIRERMRDDATLLVFELNDLFYHELKTQIQDPRVNVIHDSAEFLQKYLDEMGNGLQADVVISSLPLMVFPASLRNRIVDASYHGLKENGRFIQFQYSLQAKKMLKSLYPTVAVTFTAKNVPPAFVYTCTKS